MSKGFQIAALAGALTVAMSGNVLAAGTGVPAFNYGGWTVTNGDIDETAGGMCLAGSGFSCSVVASGKGFKQVNVTDNSDASSGISYIMTIVTDQNAGGATGAAAADLGFADVSFVRMKVATDGTAGPGDTGITARQQIKDGTGTGKTFVSVTDINSGWANTSATDNIVITQKLQDDAGTTGFAGDDFVAGFEYRSNNDAATGVRTGFEMIIDQASGLASAQFLADGTTDPSANDVQVFALREKQGDKLTTSGSIGLDPANPVTWTGASTGVVGDDVKAVWIGQEVNLGAAALDSSLGSSFGYVAFENVTTGDADNAFGFASLNSASAWEWDTATFGTTPTIAIPAIPAP